MLASLCLAMHGTQDWAGITFAWFGVHCLQLHPNWPSLAPLTHPLTHPTHLPRSFIMTKSAIPDWWIAAYWSNPWAYITQVGSGWVGREPGEVAQCSMGG